ncbi:MAG: hypothetical protein GKR95_20930 [Gammaproteobacteria bacterium]|nr:hypothetical protein [Gammaproteobacteria bacterium]
MGNDWGRIQDSILFADKLCALNDRYEITFLLKNATFLDRFPELRRFNHVFSVGKYFSSIQLIGQPRSGLFRRLFKRVAASSSQWIMENCPLSSITEFCIYFNKKNIYLNEYRHSVLMSESSDRFDVVLSHSDTHETGLGYMKGFRDLNIPVIAIV